MYCWVGDSLDNITPHLYADSDLGVVFLQLNKVPLVAITYFEDPTRVSPMLGSAYERDACRIPRWKRRWW
ncbi:MAG: hypothetical protein ACKPKO_56115, partial [Candidatus Fonsibacter sp.]